MVEEQAGTEPQQSTRDNLQVEVISDFEQFGSMGPEWDGLVKRASVEPLFASHAWFRAWWEAFSEGGQLYVVTVRAGGELVAAAPMTSAETTIYGVKFRSLKSPCNPHTPRYDFIVANGFEEAAYSAIWANLSRHGDLIRISQVPDTSRTVQTLQRLAEAEGWLAGHWVPRPAPYIPLGCDYDHLAGGFKRGFRYNLRSRYERLTKTGAVDVEVITEGSRVPQAMREGLKIEAAGWKGERGTAILCDPSVTAFYTRLAECQAELGQLQLTFLRVSGKRIAFNYVLRSGDKLYGVKIGFDPDYHTYSPSNVLLNLILREACRNGLKEYDFLGEDDKWKLDWTKESRGHTWLFLFRNSLRARLIHSLKFKMAPQAKEVLARSCTLSSRL